MGVIAAIANPQKNILGGSIGSRKELVERVQYFLKMFFPYPVDVGSSALGSWTAIVGGTAMGLEYLHNSLFDLEIPAAGMSLPLPQIVKFTEVFTAMDWLFHRRYYHNGQIRLFWCARTR